MENSKTSPLCSWDWWSYILHPRNIHLRLRSGVKIFRSKRPPGFAHDQVPIDLFKPTQPVAQDILIWRRPSQMICILCNFSRVILKRKGVWVWVCSYMTSHFIPAVGGATFEPQSFFFYTCILFHKVESIKFSQGENATHSPFRLLWPTRGKNFWDPLGGECMHLFLRVKGRSP